MIISQAEWSSSEEEEDEEEGKPSGSTNELKAVNPTQPHLQNGLP